MSDSGSSGAGLGVLALVAMVGCCAAPLLISAGVLGAIGAGLRSVVVIVVAGVIVVVAVLVAVRRHRRRGCALPRGRSAQPVKMP
jgi:hypothetical protein